MNGKDRKLASNVFEEFFEQLGLQQALPATDSQEIASSDSSQNAKNPFAGFWEEKVSAPDSDSQSELDPRLGKVVLSDETAVNKKPIRVGHRNVEDLNNSECLWTGIGLPGPGALEGSQASFHDGGTQTGGSMARLVNRLEEFHKHDPGCIEPASYRGCTPQHLDVLELHPDVFFAASTKRFVLKRWIMEHIRGLFKEEKRTSLTVNEIHSSLRKTFRTGAFSLPGLRKLLGVTYEKLTWGNFVSVEAKVLNDYNQAIFQESGTDNPSRCGLSMPMRDLLQRAFMHERKLEEVVDFVQQKTGLGEQAVLAWLLLSPYVLFDADLKPHLDETGKAMEQDAETLFWRIGMLYANGLLQKENPSKDSHEKEPSGLFDMPSLDWPEGQTEDWPISRLYCWDVPLWLIDHLKHSGICSVSELFSSRGEAALCSSLAMFQDLGVSLAAINSAKKNICAAFDLLTSASPDASNPWFLERILFPRGGPLHWEMLLCRVNGGTLEDAGVILGVTRERARQLQNKATTKFVWWLRKYGKGFVARTQRWKYVIDETLAEMLLGCDGWSVFLYLVESINSKEWFYWRGPNLLLKGVGEEFFALLDQIESAINNADSFYYDFDAYEKEFEQRGFRFVTTDVLVAYLEYRGFRKYGDSLLPARLTLGQAILFIADQHLKAPLRMSDSEALAPVRRHLAELPVKYKNTDRSLWARIQGCLVLCDRGSYVSPSRIYFPTELCEEICKYVEEMKQESVTYVELFHHFHDRLFLESNIHNPYFLHGALKYLHPERFFYQRDHLTRLDAAAIHTNSYHLLDDFLQKATSPVSKSAILQTFKGWTDIRLSYAMNAYPEIIPWGSNFFWHASKLQVENYEIQGLGEVLRVELDKNGGYVSSFKIFEAVRLRFSSLLHRNAATDEGKVFDLLKYLFKDEYYFGMPHIVNGWSEPRRFTHEDLILLCLGANQSFTRSGLFAQINALLGEMRSGAYNAVATFCKQQTRLSNDEYLMKEAFNINEQQLYGIVTVLDSIIDENGVLLASRRGDWSSSLPQLDFQWTPYLLADIVQEYFSKYKAIGVDNFWRESCAVVRAGGHLNTREDIAIWLLAKQYGKAITVSDMMAFMRLMGLYEGSLPESLMADNRLRFCENNMVYITST